MTGYSEAETIGRNCRFLQGPNTEPAAICTLKQAVSQKKPCAVELTNYRKNGESFINYLSLTPIFDSEGGLTHYVGIQSDITELIRRKEAEVEAKDAANKALLATEAKSQFLARMSHEIRTPLNGMIAVGQLLAETKLTHQQRDLVSTIRCSGETLLALITDILDFSRIEANKLSLHIHDFNLETIVEDVIEIAGLKAAQKQINVAYSLSPHIPETLRGDSTRIKQVLLNVLYNAVKFTETGFVYLQASVQVCNPRSSDGEDGETIPSYSKSDISENDVLYLIHFSVRDTGIGMTSEGISRLFVSFTQLEEMSTRKYGGTGLGLAISKKLSEAMGGEMWAESKGMGQGSTFHFTVKCHTRMGSSSGTSICPMSMGQMKSDRDLDTQSKETTDKNYASPYLLEDKACLLIEDHDTIRESLAKVMREWGLKVTALSSEQSALAYLFWPGSKSQKCIKFDFIITDRQCKELYKALITGKEDSCNGAVFMIWPAPESGVGDSISVDLKWSAPFDNDNVSFPHVCIQRPVRHSRLRMALEELCVAKRCSDEQGDGNTHRACAPESFSPDKPAASPLKVLIAEDNVVNMKVCLGILKRLGITEVTTAEDGVVALRQIEANGGPDAFDVILMDLHMPRKGGLDVMKELKEKHDSLKVKAVAVTADAFTDTKERCKEVGFTHWIPKPFRITDIEKVFEDLHQQ